MNLNLLKSFGYNAGLCSLLNTHPESGILGDEDDLDRRRKLFGANHFPVPTITPWCDLLAAQFEDIQYRGLIIWGTIYLSFSLWGGETSG